MNKVEFKLVSRHYDKVSTILRGTYYDSRVRSVCTLFTDGSFLTRPPLEVEIPQVWDIAVTGIEPVTDANGNPTGHTRNFAMFSYYPKEFWSNITDPIEHELNIKYTNLHQILKSHGDVVVKDANGQNINPNAVGDVQFELINITENVVEKNKKNQRIFEAGQKLQELYSQEDKKAFIDFCYAYSIPNIDKFDTNTLFNLCSAKINDNPDWFFAVYNSKKRDILTLIQMGLEKDLNGGSGQPKYALVQNGDSFYMDGNYIAPSREELEGILETDVTRRRILETMVGYAVTASMTEKVKPVELVVSEHVMQTKAEMHEDANIREQWTKSLNGQALGAQKFKDIAKREERYKQLHAEYDSRLGAEVVQSIIQHHDNMRARKEALKSREPIATVIKED